MKLVEITCAQKRSFITLVAQLSTFVALNFFARITERSGSFRMKYSFCSEASHRTLAELIEMQLESADKPRQVYYYYRN